MRSRLYNLVIDKFIVHDVPSKFSTSYLKNNPDQSNLEPTLSDIETPFSESLRKFFLDKLKISIGASTSFDIKYGDSSGIVPTQIDTYFCNNDLAITTSQQIALHLHKTQNARNSGGLLLFVLCHVDNTKAIAILKVEREEGVQISKIQTKDGHIHFNMEHIENLMLTQNTKLYKLVLFFREGNETKGILSDQQMGFSIGKDVAMFFLKDFLNCDLIESPSVTTKKFFESSQDFVNNSNMPQEEKANAIMHILSTLTNNTGAINIQNFAENNLNPEYADEFMSFMTEHKLPKTSFVKDITLIEHKLKKSQFSFDSGICVIAPQDTINTTLNYKSTKTGKIKMEIIDSLKKVSSK